MEPPADLDQLLGPRDTVVVEGADALSYLHSQVSQNLEGIEVGEQRWTFVLEPTGRIESFARITRSTDERFELDTDAGYGEALLARIDRFKIRVAAETSVSIGGASGADPDVERRRIEAGWPRMGTEIVPGETIPGGTGLAGLAVSFTKGCYPGQELVERMNSRAAEAPKSLRRLVVGDGAAPGDAVVDGDEEVGVLTSVVGTIALGWVKRGSDVGAVVDF